VKLFLKNDPITKAPPKLSIDLERRRSSFSPSPNTDLRVSNIHLIFRKKGSSRHVSDFNIELFRLTKVDMRRLSILDAPGHDPRGKITNVFQNQFFLKGGRFAPSFNIQRISSIKPDMLASIFRGPKQGLRKVL